MTLNDFYKQVLETLSIEEKDGYLYLTNSEGDPIPWTDNGKQLVLPTKKHLANLLEEDEDGNVEIARIPYNPLNEDVVKGDSTSLRKTKLAVELVLGHKLALVGEMMLMVASNKSLQTKTGAEINKFLGMIVDAKSHNTKHIVDDKSISLWSTMYQEALKREAGMITIYLKKGGIKDGDRYNRLAVLNSPVYDELLKAEKGDTVYEVKLDRRKDLEVFRALLKYLLPDLNSNNCLEIGSNDNECPAFVALYRTFLTVMERINTLLKLLKKVIPDAEEDIVELPITEDDLLSLNSYKQELVLIPNEVDLNRAKILPQSRIGAMSSAAMNRSVGPLTGPTIRAAGEPRRTAYPEEPVDYNASLEEEEDDPVNRIFSKLQTVVTPIDTRYQESPSPFTSRYTGINGSVSSGLSSYRQPLYNNYSSPIIGQNRFGGYNSYRPAVVNQQGFGNALSSFNPAFRR